MSFERVDSTPTPPAPKKPYRAPVLVHWGTLRDITQAVGRSGNADGGSSQQGRSKTRA